MMFSWYFYDILACDFFTTHYTLILVIDWFPNEKTISAISFLCEWKTGRRSLTWLTWLRVMCDDGYTSETNRCSWQKCSDQLHLIISPTSPVSDDKIDASFLLHLLWREYSPAFSSSCVPLKLCSLDRLFSNNKQNGVTLERWKRVC